MIARPGMGGPALDAVEGWFGRLVRLSRPDGSTVFGPRGRDPLRIETLHLGSQLLRDPALAAVVGRWFPDLGTSTASPPLPAASDADRILGVLRPDWNLDGDWIVADHRVANRPTRLELAADGRPWLRGDWTTRDPSAPTGKPRPVAWSTGPYADGLEWSFRSGPTKVTRTAVLLRYRKVALVAQQEEGPPLPSGFGLDLADGVTAGQVADLSSWRLARRGAKAQLIPLGLSPLPSSNGGSSLRVEGSRVVLGAEEPSRRRWLPIIVAWGRGPSQWRTLTVTEKSTICPPGIAFGARLSWGVGVDGLLIYRSLAKPALRVVLGHQTRARFLIARFTIDGNVVPLLSWD